MYFFFDIFGFTLLQNEYFETFKQILFSKKNSVSYDDIKR